jgi:hypothetical protein
MYHRKSWILTGVTGLGIAASLLIQSGGAGADKPAASKADPKGKVTGEDALFFKKDVLPLLTTRCFKCHGGGKVKGELRLTSRDAILKGGETGPAVSLEQPAASLLLKAINYKDDLEMPPDGRLPPKAVEILTRWVKKGIPWDPGTVIAGATEKKGGAVTKEARNYWAYRPVKRPSLPNIKDRGWVSDPIDAFILARLEAKGLGPAPPADPTALVRRVYYDLTGLPPTPREVDAFVADPSPPAYERLIDRLLASPHHGEKWGRHWLDLVRYAETNGYERDSPKPYAWRFRDYVVRSFNADKPFDRFVEEQIAGDEIDRDNPDCVIATGYYRLGIWDDEPADRVQAPFDELDDIVATTSQVFLGMTMNCARCHDHKIDPIPQKDYYRMVAFFRDIPSYGGSSILTDIAAPALRAGYEKALQKRKVRKAELALAMKKIEDAAIVKMPAEDQRAAEGPDRKRVLARKLKRFLTPGNADAYAKLKREFEALRKEPEPASAMALSVNHCRTHPPETHVLVRGNAHVPGPKVEPAFPEVLGTPPPVIPAPARQARSSGRRTVLARWIASAENPMTARVLANRLWQYHFGRGIVVSANDFGKFGTLPTHPELLDWLASELVAGGWKLKRMHKLIMLSSAYRMSSRGSESGLRTDPDNAQLWRFNMRRLTAEEVRDTMLAVSGQLNPRMGGPSVFPPIPRDVLAGQSVPGQGWGRSPPKEAARRSVYVHVKRSLLVPVLAQHDQADTDSSCPVRYTTTVPTQALGMLNGHFTNEQAAALAERLQRKAPDSLERQVHRAIRLTTGRNADDGEVKKDVAFVNRLRETLRLDAPAALRQYCLLALNTNELMYVD